MASSTKYRCGGWYGIYIAQPVDGLILAATTGEGLTLDPRETERLVFTVRDEVGNNALPVCLGLVRSNHRALLDTLDRTAAWPIGRLSDFLPVLFAAVPAWPGAALRRTGDRAARPVLLYNIP